MKDRNLVNSLGGRTKNKAKRVWSEKTMQRVSYLAIFVMVLALATTSYTSADSNTQVSLPGAANSDSIDVNLLQGQKIDQVNKANEVASSVSDNTGVASGASAVNTSSDSAPSAASTATTATDVKAANIASTVASVANLSSSSSASSNAESANITAEMAQSDATSASKTQIINSDEDESSSLFATYKVKDGDDAEKVAKQYNVSAQTVRWANKLKDNKLQPGATITVPTIDGVVYTVKDGDKLSDLANKYKSTTDDIVNINNLNSDTVAKGTRILLPDGILPENERPEYNANTHNTTVQTTSNRSTASTSNTSTRSSSSSIRANLSAGQRGVRSSLSVPLASGNRYAYGYCTWYAYNRRAQLGIPIPAVSWGNANTWDTGARASGYTVDSIPSAGAVFQVDSGPYGHVGIVEEVYSDGSIHVSEMNYAGWNIISEGYLTPSQYSGYQFIH